MGSRQRSGVRSQLPVVSLRKLSGQGRQWLDCRANRRWSKQLTGLRPGGAKKRLAFVADCCINAAGNDMLGRAWKSNVGKKFLMASTGAGLVVFALFHMMGNLQMFLGRDSINHYAGVLHNNPEFLWPARIGLLVFAVVHVATGIALTIENRRARVERYETRQLVKATVASRTMLWTGSVVGIYVIYHLLHFTVGKIDPSLLQFMDVKGHRDVYRMMLRAFNDRWVAGGYIAAMGVLCFHLSHGVAALFQSLGLKKPEYTPVIERGAEIVAVALLIGFAAVPMAVQMGWVK